GVDTAHPPLVILTEARKEVRAEPCARRRLPRVAKRSCHRTAALIDVIDVLRGVRSQGNAELTGDAFFGGEVHPEKVGAEVRTPRPSQAPCFGFIRGGQRGAKHVDSTFNRLDGIGPVYRIDALGSET